MGYSDAELLEDIRAVADIVERSPTLQDYRNHGEHSASTMYRRFESWQEAVAHAGFEPHDPETEIPEADLCEELRSLADELGEVPTTAEMNEHGRYWSKVYRDRFGSWGEALEAAGLDASEINDHPGPLSRAALLDELERLAAERDGAPSATQMAAEGAHSPETYRQEFGSWNAAIEAIGYEPRDRGPVMDEELLGDLHRLANALGERPVSTDVVERGEYALSTYQRRFGSWSAAVEAAGLDADEGRVTEEELLVDLQRLHETLERVPSLSDVREHGVYGAVTYRRQFGSWAAAVEASGFETERGLTDEELLADLRRLRDDLHRRPSRDDVAEHGAYDGATYERRFGSWSAALAAAFDEAVAEETA